MSSNTKIKRLTALVCVKNTSCLQRKQNSEYLQEAEFINDSRQFVALMNREEFPFDRVNEKHKAISIKSISSLEFVVVIYPFTNPQNVTQSKEFRWT